MSKDMIYKQSALDILDDFQSDIENGTPHAYSMARQRMLGLYPRNPKWIPCSERLPEKDGFYLTTITDGDQIAVCKLPFAKSEWRGNWFDDEVLAWMPLPEPWKGADDGTR